MSRKSDPELLEMAAQLETSAGGRGRRSPLFRWLFRRAADFDQMLAEMQPSWRSVSEAFKRLEVKDGANQFPTAERCRKTWMAVRWAKGWADEPVPEPTPSPPLIVHQPPPPTDRPDVVTVESTPDARARMRAQFKPVTIRKTQE